MRRMLDPTKVGGIPSTIEFDKDGYRKVSKDLGVDGKLKLKSLVSASNPDGDITKALGGGEQHLYRLLLDNLWYISITPKDYGFNIGEYTSAPSDFTINDKYKDLRSEGVHAVGGIYKYNIIPSTFYLDSSINSATLYGYDIKQSEQTSISISLNRLVSIVQLN